MGLIPTLGFAQSAQATMRVSVRIVSGNSVQTEQPPLVSLAQDSSSVIGKLKVKGADASGTLIRVAGNVTLKGADGKQIKLKVSHSQNQNDNHSSSVDLKGVSNKKMLVGLYKGELTTTVEYY